MLGLRKQQGNSETIPVWVCTTERRQYGEAIRDGVGSMFDGNPLGPEYPGPE